MKKITLSLVAVLLFMLLTSCTSEGSAHRALTAQGFTNIETTGYSPFSCGEDDLTSTGFRATNSRGVRVEGTVCCGVFKNCTVRW